MYCTTKVILLCRNRDKYFFLRFMTDRRQNNTTTTPFTFALAALTVGRRISPVAGQTAANGSSLGHAALSVGTTRTWRTRICVPARVRRRIVDDHTWYMHKYLDQNLCRRNLSR